jgi:hypothetical protein
MMMTGKRCKKVMQRRQNIARRRGKPRPLPMNLDGSAGKTPDPKFWNPDLTGFRPT